MSHQLTTKNLSSSENNIFATSNNSRTKMNISSAKVDDANSSERLFRKKVIAIACINLNEVYDSKYIMPNRLKENNY